MVLSCETPCLVNETPVTARDKISTITFEEEKSTISSKMEMKDDENKISVIEDSEDDAQHSGGEDNDDAPHHDVKNNEPYDADFSVTDTTNKILISDNDLQETTMDVSKVSPCIAHRNSLPLQTSTPHASATVGSTKKEYLQLRKKISSLVDSSIPRPSNYQNKNNIISNSKCNNHKAEKSNNDTGSKDHSPVRQPVNIVVDSPVKENMKHRCLEKRKIISSSSENLSSGCESRDFGMNKRKRRKCGLLNEMFPARIVTKISSSSDDDEEVSESDAPLFSPQLRSSFKGTPSRKKRISIRKTTKTPSPSSRNKSTSPSKPTGSPWLLAKNISPQKKR